FGSILGFASISAIGIENITLKLSGAISVLGNASSSGIIRVSFFLKISVDRKPSPINSIRLGFLISSFKSPRLIEAISSNPLLTRSSFISANADDILGEDKSLYASALER